MVTLPARASAPVVVITDGQPTTTSRDIADAFGKRHDDVLKRIRTLECSEEFRLRNFAEASYEAPQPNGGSAKYTEYRITRDGFAFLCMGFTGKRAAAWKERYIATFNAMESELRANPVSVDIRRAMLDGTHRLDRPLTQRQQAAVNRKAWELSGQAYELIREHIAARLAGATVQPTRDADAPKVYDVIRSVTLDTALAHQHNLAVEQLEALAEIQARIANETVTRLAGLRRTTMDSLARRTTPQGHNHGC